MPLTEIQEKYPSTTWGKEEWFQAFKNDEGLYFAILNGIAGVRTNNKKGQHGV